VFTKQPRVQKIEEGADSYIEEEAIWHVSKIKKKYWHWCILWGNKMDLKK